MALIINSMPSHIYKGVQNIYTNNYLNVLNIPFLHKQIFWVTTIGMETYKSVILIFKIKCSYKTKEFICLSTYTWIMEIDVKEHEY